MAPKYLYQIFLVNFCLVLIDDDTWPEPASKSLALKLSDHLMLTKLLNGGAPVAKASNSYAMRLMMSRAERHAGDAVPKASYSDADKTNACVRAVRNLVGSVIFCLRDIVLSMMQSEQSELFKQFGERFHVCMFVGPYKMNAAHGKMTTAEVFARAQSRPEAADGEIGLSDVARNLIWTIEFNSMSVGQCDKTHVQYLLIENFTGSVHPVVAVNGLASLLPGVPRRESRASNEHMNSGLMSLSDILSNHNALRLQSDSISIPHWRDASFDHSTDVGTAFVQAVTVVWKLMYDFLWFQTDQAIALEPASTTFNLKEYMEHISLAVTMNPGNMHPLTRRQLTMTTNPVANNPASLRGRLQASLRLTLPQLDESVQEYLRSQGFDHIRDVTLYLRLIGVTNVLALASIARSHEMLLATDEYHSRVFRSLSIGSQSEMKVMFQRIVVHPFAPVQDVPISKMIAKLSLHHVRNYPQGKAYNLISALCALARTTQATQARSGGDPWFGNNIAGYAILHALVVNSENVMTQGAYLASTAWPDYASQLQANKIPLSCQDFIVGIKRDMLCLEFRSSDEAKDDSSSSDNAQPESLLAAFSSVRRVKKQATLVPGFDEEHFIPLPRYFAEKTSIASKGVSSVFEGKRKIFDSDGEEQVMPSLPGGMAFAEKLSIPSFGASSVFRGQRKEFSDSEEEVTEHANSTTGEADDGAEMEFPGYAVPSSMRMAARYKSVGKNVKLVPARDLHVPPPVKKVSLKQTLRVEHFDIDKCQHDNWMYENHDSNYYY